MTKQERMEKIEKEIGKIADSCMYAFPKSYTNSQILAFQKGIDKMWSILKEGTTIRPLLLEGLDEEEVLRLIQIHCLPLVIERESAKDVNAVGLAKAICEKFGR